MRVALIRQRYNPFGGAERIIERAIEALEREGTEITLITRAWESGGNRRALVVNPPYIGRLWREISFAKGARAVLAKISFDLVQSHERIPGCDVYRAGDGVHRQWLDNRLERAPFFERVGIRINPYHRYVCAAERTMFEHPGLRAVICNSNMVALEIGARFSIRPEKLHVIYNGVDLEHFHPARRHSLREAARKQFGCRSGDTVFSFVGSGFARKGLEATISALAATGREDFRLIVAGKDRETARFQTQARRAGIAGRVTFLGGIEDVRPVYAASDCFILPTRYDPFPNAALEALSMGVPIIVSNRCGAAELIEAGVNGWVIESDNVPSLAKTITEASHLSMNGVLGKGARQTAEGFGLEKMADRMTDLYKRLMRTRGEAAIAG